MQKAWFRPLKAKEPGNIDKETLIGRRCSVFYCYTGIIRNSIGKLFSEAFFQPLFTIR